MHVYAVKMWPVKPVRQTALFGWFLLNYDIKKTLGTAIPADCWKMLDICMNKLRKDLCLF